MEATSTRRLFFVRQYGQSICLLALLLFFYLLLSACSTNPATGDSDFVLMSEAEEVRLGKTSHKQALQAYGRYDNEALQRYVNKIGQRLARVSHRPGLDYQFTVVDSSEVNAFALPGGYIYITRGMLTYLENEAELAAVLGHEIGHVTARHAVRQQSTTAAVGVAGAVLAAATGISGAEQLTGLAGSAIVKGYSRGMELEADGFGAQYVVNAGYNADAMKQVIQVLKDQEKYERYVAKQEGREPNIYHGLFSSHPDNDARLDEILKQAKKCSKATQQRPDNEVVYLATISGMAYGDNADQGILRGNEFSHQGLGFAITLPENWQVENSSDELIALSPDGAARFQLSLGQPQAGLSGEQYLKSAFKMSSLQRDRDLSSQGKQGVTGQSIVRAGSSSLPARLGYAELNDHVFLMVGLAKDQTTLRRYDRTFLQSMQSLRQLDKNEQPAGGPLRVVFYTVRAGDSWSALAARSRIPEHAEQQLRLMNDQYPRGELRAGQLIKIVE